MTHSTELTMPPETETLVRGGRPIHREGASEPLGDQIERETRERAFYMAVVWPQICASWCE